MLHRAGGIGKGRSGCFGSPRTNCIPLPSVFSATRPAKAGGFDPKWHKRHGLGRLQKTPVFIREIREIRGRKSCRHLTVDCQYTTKKVCFIPPPHICVNRVIPVFDQNHHKCLHINHLQPNSPIFQSSLIKPNQSKSCLIVLKQASLFFLPIAENGQTSTK